MQIYFYFRPLWHYYFENNDAIIYVIDSSDRERFGEAKEELWDLIKDDRLRGSSLLVLANKQV
jgi:GTPase SAR1 family protein